MKNKHSSVKNNHKQQIKTWVIRIFALLLVLLMLVGSCYYTIWALFL